ncbi:MAG: hypothetical protein B6D63_00830 [Candidatus Latescibacteria bacterium 4484_7]|nr:MAG: hypothetical protein B6D63_00830 [Candidatus Latescibacteria bacterium 4484_7]RKZ08891.1 MAG: hypothetical protein DRQ05_00695 [bacterium]
MDDSTVVEEGEKILKMLGEITAVALSFLLCHLFTPLVKGIAVRLNIGEKPNGRTSRDLVHIGGVAIIGAVLFTLLPFFLFFIEEAPLTRILVPLLIASGFLIFLLGIIDDLRSLHYSYKLIIQIAVSVFVAAFGLALLSHFRVTSLSIYGNIIAFIVVSIWMLVITTSFNLIDGVDGLASGLAFIYAVAFAAVGMIFGEPLVTTLSLVVAGSVFAFLKYNFPPAKILMGDTGSLFLGLLFGFITLVAVVKAKSLFLTAAGSVVILSVPILDTGLAFSRRLITGRPVFEADHKHMHHILLYRFRSVRIVDFIIWSIAAGTAILGVYVVKGSLICLVVALAIDGALFFVMLRAMTQAGISEEELIEILHS